MRKATLLEKLFGGLHNGADLYPRAAIDPPGVNDQQRRQLDLQDMHLSQQVAAAVALRAAGKKVVMRAVGVRVTSVGQGLPAFGKLEPGDVIVAVDGTPTAHDQRLRPDDRASRRRRRRASRSAAARRRSSRR